MEVPVAAAVVGGTIKVVLENLLSYPVEEIGQLWNFKKEVQKLRDSIFLIRDFLEDAEMKQVSGKAMTRWLMKLEAVAFDADYVFDVLNYKVLRKNVETDHKLKKQVSDFFTSNPILSRGKMAGKIKKINNELDSINQMAKGLGLQEGMASAPARGAGAEAQAYMETDSLSMDPVFVGRENDVGKIVEMVTGNSSTENLVSVLPIVGMGGLGKTTLARQVYNAQKIISHFEKRIWVDVGLDFDPLVVFKKILESLTEENVDGSRDVVLRKLQRSLSCKRYLLVLDNFWDEDNEKWENFIISSRGISGVKGNVIMVTTRKGNVATIVKDIGVHELGVLTEENCLSIIEAKAFGGKVISAEFETIGKNIAKRCQGLPLAAQVVGSLLRTKTKDEWVSIDKNWLSKFGGDGNIVSKMLKLSFDHLPSPSLKKCFALCSIIPRGWWMHKDEMIQLWMAEGYLKPEEEDDMETVGNREFDTLLQSSLLQVSRRDYYGNVERFKMHDLVHDLALSILSPKSLSDMNRVRYVSRLHIDDSSSISKENAECLRALFFQGKTSQITFSNFKCLHTLILIDKDLIELPNEIGKLICLRYLDISHTKMECLPDSIGNLYHLQTLRATIESGRRCYLRKLPYTFEFLINLRHLYIPNIELPPKIGKLISLQTLPYFKVGDKDGCRIMELGSLNNLKGELEIHNLERVCDKEEAKNACLFHKRILKLKLVWNERGQVDTNDEHVLEGLQPHPALKRLEIKGFESKSFPLWTFQMSVKDLEHRWIRLDNLLEVRLSDCKECEEIPMLGHLPHLKSLSLHHLPKVKHLGSSFYGIKENEVNKEKIVGFPALENLELVDMANLTAWTKVELSRPTGIQPHEALDFPRLEYLKIINCRQLISTPSHFPCLKELEIDNMESCLPLENICGSGLTTLTKLIICKVDGLMRLPVPLFHNNRDLSELEIRRCNNLLFLVFLLFRSGGFSLEKLVIKHCPNLKLILTPLSQGFTSIRDLIFLDCRGLTNFPCEMLESCTLSLQQLRLSGSRSLRNLPQVMSILHKMPHLTHLGIERVPKVNDVVAKIGLLHNLQILHIGGSSDFQDYVSFKASLDHIFPRLITSLRVLGLYGMMNWDALPEQLLHLTTLYALMIFEFGIEELPEWIGNLSSLTCLAVCACPNLRRLPSKNAMLRLTDFDIVQCPLLEQNVKQEASDSEWHKISHISSVKVDTRPYVGPRAR